MVTSKPVHTAAPTVNSLPEPTSTAEEPTPEPPAAVLFEDDFSDAGGGWSISSNNKSVGKYDNGQYELQILVEKLLIWTTAASGDLSNIRVELSAASAGVANDPGMGAISGYQDDD